MKFDNEEDLFNKINEHVSSENKKEKQERDVINADNITVIPDDENYPELEDNIYYKVNEKPQKYIIAYKQRYQVIEVTIRTKIEGSGFNKTVKKYLIHNNTFLACMPIKIIRHISPLAFLQTAQKYTIIFVDVIGKHFTLAHKTLPEINQCLKDDGYILHDGSDKALNALLCAYIERKIIEDNHELNYVGFFPDKDNKIIASNVDIIKPNCDKVSDALKFIIELKTHYENREDLLATSIIWGMIAPMMFILKGNNHYLKLLQFYGSPNATKTNTGKLILALDGHQDDRKYSLNLTRFDSIARVGEALGYSTFPILVDETNLSDPKSHWLVELLKSIVETRISRTKFPISSASGTIDIPALSLPIFTGNPPPPLNESAYMKRVYARYFPQSETMLESDPRSTKFREFIRVSLPRLKALGDFRNWFIMNNQREFLDENSPPPLDLGLKILKAAFQYCGIEMPIWLIEKRLPEDQLEESLEDNDVIVKRAFEKYIDEQFNRGLQFWKSKDADHIVDVPKEISDRFTKLAQDNLLPDVKYTRNFEVIIGKGIIEELYDHGVTAKQLPNLRSLAEYMNGEYRVSHGKKVVAVNKHQLTSFFDKEYVDSGDMGDTGDPVLSIQGKKNGSLVGQDVLGWHP